MFSIAIGPVPHEEASEQLGPHYRPEIARAECRLFIRAIKLPCGAPPEGCKLIVTENDHDFGRYFEVAVQGEGVAAESYVEHVEANAPATWPEALAQIARDLRAGDAVDEDGELCECGVMMAPNDPPHECGIE